MNSESRIINPNTGQTVRSEAGPDRRKHAGFRPRFLVGDTFTLKGRLFRVSETRDGELILEGQPKVFQIGEFLPLRGVQFKVIERHLVRGLLKLEPQGFTKSHAKAMRREAAKKGIR